MAAIENLEAAVASNTVAVDAAVAKIDALVASGTGIDPVRVQTAADQVAADADRLSIKSA